MWLCMAKPDIHQFRDEIKLCPYCMGHVTTISRVDIEMQARKHAGSIFGTVPQKQEVLEIKALADKIEALLKDRK